MTRCELCAVDILGCPCSLGTCPLTTGQGLSCSAPCKQVRKVFMAGGTQEHRVARWLFCSHTHTLQVLHTHANSQQPQSTAYPGTLLPFPTSAPRLVCRFPSALPGPLLWPSRLSRCSPLMQVASGQHVVLFDLLTLCRHHNQALQACLQPLLSNPAVLKLGFEVSGDLAKLAASWGRQVPAFCHVAGVLDLRPLWVEYGIRSKLQVRGSDADVLRRGMRVCLFHGRAHVGMFVFVHACPPACARAAGQRECGPLTLNHSRQAGLGYTMREGLRHGWRQSRGSLAKGQRSCGASQQHRALSPAKDRLLGCCFSCPSQGRASAHPDGVLSVLSA